MFSKWLGKEKQGMGLKRRPPDGNVRRVVSIGGNLRYTVTGKANQTVQCESFLERKLTLCFDRDPSIRTYVSQPEQLSYLDTDGKTRTYTPDFMVWRISGEVELHEVTLTARSDQQRLQERAKAARAICKERHWRYVVHTEVTLPKETEEANLLALARYRPTAYGNTEVARFVEAHLVSFGAPVPFQSLVAEIKERLQLQEPTAVSALCHLLWHGKLETDLCHTLIFQNAAPCANVFVRLPKERCSS